MAAPARSTGSAIFSLRIATAMVVSAAIDDSDFTTAASRQTLQIDLA